jgi:hypothetical protein
LKSRLESKAYEAPVVPTPAMPELDLGLAKPNVGTAPTMETAKAPTSQVKEQAIKIPTFLKK